MRQIAFSFYLFLSSFCFSKGTESLAYDKNVRPILQKKCFGCHNEKKQKGKIRLDNLSPDLINDIRSAETWHDVRGVINLGEMPPDDEEDLTTEERKIVLDWLNPTIENAFKTRQSKGGEVVLRRLTRGQYDNTLRDLLGLDIDHARDIPEDPPSTDGFHNNGSSLQMTGEQLEHYIQSARLSLDSAIVTTEQPETFHHTFEKFSKVRMDGGVLAANRLGPQSRFVGHIKKDYPEIGPFEVRVKAHADLPETKGPIPRMRVIVGYRPDTLLQEETLAEIDITKEGSQEYIFTGRIENFPLPVRGQGKYPGLLINVENVTDEDKPVKTEKKKDAKGKNKNVRVEDPDYPYLVIESVEFKGPIYETWPPKHHQAILLDSKEKHPGNEEAQVQQIFQNFLPKAWRKEVSNEEVKKFVKFFARIRPDFPTYEEALKETLVMTLVSPEFLFLTEPGTDKNRKLTPYEVASRLSYFLWNTMPDKILFDLAKSKEILKSEVLAKQVYRMVADPRSWEFIETFTSQWLHIDAIDRIEVDESVYSKQPQNLKENFRKETLHFFSTILKENLSAENFIHSDFQLLNRDLAKHYKQKELFGGEFRKVKKADQRGGLLTQGSFLLGHSTGIDSHIIKRAVFIRKNLLGNPPAPPPPNVPELDTANPDFAKLPIQEQLKIHMEDPACAECHRGIDPWGFPLEAFGATGQIRTSIPRRLDKKRKLNLEVITSTTLPDGTRLNDLEDLKNYLLTKRKDQFAKALTSKLLAYALGRSLEFTDEPLLGTLTNKGVENGLLLRSLVTSIVQSEAFLRK